MVEPVKMFRDQEGNVQHPLDFVEGKTFAKDPLPLLFSLVRSKFAGRFLRPTDLVLDAGCGPGMGTVVLRQFCQTVVGMDLDLDLVTNNARRYSSLSGVVFTEGDIRCLPSQWEAWFDVVVCLDTIEHIERKEATDAFRELKRVLKLGGLLVIGTSSRTSYPYASERRKNSHLYEYTSEEFRSLLEEHFTRPLMFGTTDENISTAFLPLAWGFISLCVKI